MSDDKVAVLEVPASEQEFWAIPDGFTLEWMPDPGCRPASIEEHEQRVCRRPNCGGKPVMAMMRVGGHWWLYCDRHLYGRRIHRGVVEMRRAAQPSLVSGLPPDTARAMKDLVIRALVLRAGGFIAIPPHELEAAQPGGLRFEVGEGTLGISVTPPLPGDPEEDPYWCSLEDDDEDEA